ncbi:MAG: 50S ribosomal protein L18 [Thermoplasmatota archaeon]
MAHGPLYRVPFRRRREGKTDYRHRLALLKSAKPRVVVRRSARNVTVQFVNYEPAGDKVVAQAHSRELESHGWSGYTVNLPAAYLTGLLAASRAKKHGVTEGVLDIGEQAPKPKGRLFAALRGVVDGGITVPHGDDVLPDDARTRGEHLDATDAAAFAAAYQKIAGAPLPPKKEAPKKKKEAPKAPPPAAKKSGGGGAPKAATAPPKAAKGDKEEKSGNKWAGKGKKAKTPE